MRDNAMRERDVEERLTGIESPEPPADLLDRIRGDIPRYAQPAARGDSGASGGGFTWRRSRLLAASVFLAVVGGLLAYRVSQEVLEPTGTPATTADDRIEVPDDRATTEVGPQIAAVEDASRGDTGPPTGKVLADAEARGDDGPEMKEMRYHDELAVEGQTGHRVASPATLEAEEPVAVSGDEVLQESFRTGEATSTEIGEVRADAPGSRKASRRRESGPGDETGRNERDGLPSGGPKRVVVDTDAVSGTPQTTVSGQSGTDREVASAESEFAARQSTVGVQRDRLHTEMGRFIQPRTEPAPAPIPTPSTGGTAEPNDQPYGDMFFRAWGTNPFVDTEDDAQSTFGLDVDTGSYTLTRSYLERGHLPPSEAIRVEEFINFFDYRDPAPRRGEFTVTAEGAPSPWARGPRYQLLRIGIRGREISNVDRKDATLIFVVDVSGSMARENRIGLVKQALHLLLGQLGSGDRVGLVVYGSRGQVLLEPSNDLATVGRAIDRLATGGSTNAEEGLVLGFDMARRHFRNGAINRIVLCSDGVANVGRTGPESILARISREAEAGIELTTVGFGMGNYNDVLMEQLADKGNGNYAYVDTVDEAHRVFVENLTATLETIAADAKVQVEFDPRTVSRYRLLGYENRDVADHRFRDDSVDAGEIGAGHTVTALYEIKLADEGSRRGSLGEVRLRYFSKAAGRVIEDSLELRRSLLAGSWRSASPSLQLAAVAAELAEVLKGSYWTKEADLGQLLRRAETMKRHFPGDPDVDGLVDLVVRVSRQIEDRPDVRD